MKKNMLKRAGSVMLATALTTSSFSGYGLQMPYVKAEKGEASPIAKNKFDSGYDSQNAYSGTDLGCTYTKEKTTFKVWSPLATSVVLCRYATGSDGENGAESLGTINMEKGEKGVWSCTVEGDIVNTYYTYKVTANGTTKEAVDIYAKAVGVNGDRAMVVDLDSTDPENWDTNYQRETMKLSDISVWEVHVRDFSIDVSSGVSEKYRGKYKAFTETGTTINGKGRISTCVDYLKDLGVTHVQILPMYDYASVDETKVTTSLGSNYNWGYDPENYNAPEGSYSTNPYDGNVRITEMKEMIQALHDAGIKVIMDVVYNHTYDTADSNFNKIMPDYYYKINNNMTYNNQSGCGNATRSESAMYNKFMRESLLYWAEEYNLDGFRFDLMGIHDVTTMNQIRSDMDKKFGEDKIVLYGEGWTGDGAYDSNSAHKANESKLADDIGYFNDQIRDAIKGEHKFDKTIGLVQTNYGTGSYLEEGEKWPNNVFGGIMGSVGYTAGQWGMWRPWWSKSSNSVLAYCSAHDNLTLWDKLTEIEGKNFNSTSDKMLRMNKMAGAVTLVSHGGYFMQAGEEFARTKYGDENSYSSPDSANKIDWTRVETYSNIQQYYKGMLQIRNVFSGLKTEWTRSNDNWKPNNCNLEWLKTDVYGVSAFTLSNTVSGEWNKIGVIINNSTQETTYNLGSGQWVVIADGNTAGLTKIAEYDGSSVKAAGKSVVVAVPKDTFDANPNIADKLNKNSAPTISGAQDKTVTAGSNVEFTVTTKDTDGDTVTLSVSGLPDGAKFDEKTGKFTWENVQKGIYEVKFTATDGTATTTKTITITVSSTSDALDNYIAEVEAAGYTSDMLVKETWNTLYQAFENAKSVAANTNATIEECNVAVTNLQSAYTKATNEIQAAENLKSYITTASEKITKADGVCDVELVSDAKTVLDEAKALLENKAVERGYSDAKANLEDSVNCLVTGNSTPCVHVSSPWATSYIYIWTGDDTTATKYAGAWPGTKLTEKDSDGNYYFELKEDIEYKIIINNGGSGKKTTDLKNLSGDITIKVANSSSGKEGTDEVYDAETTCKELSSGTVEISKESLKSVLDEASKYCEVEIGIGELTFTTLCGKYSTAKLVYDNEEATQLEVNQATRALRAALLDYLYVSGDIASLTPTPTPSETPNCHTTPPSTTDPTDTMPPSDNPGETDNPGNSDGTMPPASTAPASIAPPVSDDPNNTQDSNGGVNQGGTNEPANTNGSNNTSDPNNTSNPNNTNDPVIIPTQNPNGTVITTQPPNGNGGENNPVIIPTQNPNGTVIPTPSANTATEVPSGNVTATPITNTTVPPANVGNTPTPTATNAPNNTTPPSTSNGIGQSSNLTVTLETNKLSPQKAGTKVNLNATVEGGQGEYEYYFFYQKSGSKEYTTIQEYGLDNECVWQPKSGGTYNIYVRVKDATGATVTTSIKSFKISGLAASIKMNKKSPQLKKTTMKIKVNAKNGVGKVKYQYIVKLKNKTEKKTAYRSSNVYAWKPNKAGKYKLYVKIKDATTTIVKSKSFVIK